MPKLLTQGVSLEPKNGRQLIGIVAGFKSERWPVIDRNAGRLQLGIRNRAVAKALELKEKAEEEYPHLPPLRAWLTYFLANSTIPHYKGIARGNYLRSRMIEYPFIKKSEPGKKVQFLTDDGSRDVMTIAARFHHTSLHQVDRFFMQVRRSIAGLERAPQYPRRASRKWYLYGCYSPEMVEKMLTIFRTYFNFIAKGEDGKTPAMRLGLAKGPVRFEDIIYLP